MQKPTRGKNNIMRMYRSVVSAGKPATGGKTNVIYLIHVYTSCSI